MLGKLIEVSKENEMSIVIVGSMYSYCSERMSHLVVLSFINAQTILFFSQILK